MNNLENEYIHGDKFYTVSDFIFSDMIKHNYDSLKNKSGIIFCKTDYLNELFDHIRDSNSRYLLISHNSDFCVTEEVWNHKPESIKIWFAQNATFRHPNLIPIPIGMERPLLYTPTGIRKGENGDISALQQALSIDTPKNKKVIMAFTPSTNIKERSPIIDHFKDIPWVTYIKDRVPFKNYIDILKDHQYVISPEGNGPDCIRTWEALYLNGVVPIVKRSVLTEYFKELPILIVDDFRTLTLDYLDNSYDNICKKSKDMATMSYWYKFIREKAGEIL